MVKLIMVALMLVIVAMLLANVSGGAAITEHIHIRQAKPSFMNECGMYQNGPIGSVSDFDCAMQKAAQYEIKKMVKTCFTGVAVIPCLQKYVEGFE